MCRKWSSGYIHKCLLYHCRRLAYISFKGSCTCTNCFNSWFSLIFHLISWHKITSKLAPKCFPHKWEQWADRLKESSSRCKCLPKMTVSTQVSLNLHFLIMALCERGRDAQWEQGSLNLYNVRACRVNGWQKLVLTPCIVFECLARRVHLHLFSSIYITCAFIFLGLSQ